MSMKYDRETKAAVLSALLTGQAVSDVAERYNIPQSTVRYWQAKMQNIADVPDDEREKIGILLLNYLIATLETLKIQSMVFRDEEWLRDQDAPGLAVLHGVITDKAIRLLEALQPNAE